MIEKCERCGNENEGDSVYYCRECKTYFCDLCLGKSVGSFARAMSGITYHSFCPECSDGGYIGNVSKIGSARKDVEENPRKRKPRL